MAFDFKNVRNDGREKAKERYASGGKVHSDEAEDEAMFKRMMKKHPDEKQDKALLKKELSKAKIKLRKGGEVEGEKTHHRLDKLARGGKPKKGTAGNKVNVIIAGGSDDGAKKAAFQQGVGMGARAAANQMAQAQQAPQQNPDVGQPPMKRGGMRKGK